ncbi:hypothetical protein EYC80_006467 [Monilinia laxa]|uniref:Transcription factor domain-containing protein n=1 Tax=Monilinia laxa TaxID=61186 RepID=A0A5N6JTH9_MONLA|nr:hypothetical protein EYC80_006467 [Monilinia laxa]
MSCEVRKSGRNRRRHDKIILLINNTCNRAYPCNICISRNVPEKCSYSSSTSLDDLKYPRPNLGSINKRPRDEEVILKSGSTPSNLFGQVGYAPHNNFFILYQENQIVVAFLEISSIFPHYYFSKIGMEIMSLLGRHSSTLIAIEHDLMRSGWLKNYSRGTEAWHLLGSAIRQGQDLGLHLQASIPKVDGEDVRIRSEKLCHMSVMLGRPRSINPGDRTIERPIDCTFLADLSTTIPTATPLQDLQYSPSAYSPQLFQYSLAQKVKGSKEDLDDGSRTVTRKYGVSHGVSLQTENVLEAQQPLPTAINPHTALPGLDFHNYEMDMSFWEEMNQMIDFDIGVSMEEDLWNPNYSFPGLDPSGDGWPPGLNNVLSDNSAID